MKKIVLTAALSACAAIVTAQTVTSANIVGYAKKSLPDSSFLIVSPQFQGMDAGTTLGNAFSGLNNGSSVYMFNGTAYDKYDYFAGYGWFQGITPSDSVVINAGDAVWVKDGGGGAVPIMSGEVPSASSVTNTLQAGFNLIANPYPVALRLDAIPAASLTSGDSVYVFNGTAYDKYDYFGTYGWFQGINPAGSTEIAVGDGFWLSSAAGGSLILNKAY